MTGIIAVPGVISSRDATLVKAVVAGLMPEIDLLVRGATAPLIARITELEQRELLLPEKGEPGDPGTPGERGPAGEVDMDAVKTLIDAAVATLPPAEKGEPGRDVDMDDVSKRIDSAVQSAVAALPAPKDGEPGKDGIGLADALKDADGNLVVVMTDGRTKSLGKIDGTDGKDGADGITPSFIDAEFEGRTLRLKFDGDRACEFQMATPKYCGVYKEGAVYELGDIVTWAGSAWHCDEAKGLKPGAPESGWTLMVKAGRPGKDAGK